MSFMVKWNKLPLDRRKELVNAQLRKEPNRVPLIVDRDSHACQLILSKNKFSVPREYTFGRFLQVLRKRSKLDSTQGMFWFNAQNQLVPLTELCGALYDKHKSEDGTLQFTYTVESTFGGEEEEGMSIFQEDLKIERPPTPAEDPSPIASGTRTPKTEIGPDPSPQDHKESPNRYRRTALCVTLVAFGFLCFYIAVNMYEDCFGADSNAELRDLVERSIRTANSLPRPAKRTTAK